jgi:hypothetical protein
MSLTAGHELMPMEAHAICAVLHAVEHIDVTVDIDADYVAHVRPVGTMSTFEEVTALRAVAALTDRVVWDGPR